jgi:copper oxidase (laccase) domain-containing protein
MIAQDQPTIFGDSVVAAVSSADDGNMKFGRGDDDETRSARVEFLAAHDLEPSQTTLLQVTYDTTDFCRYSILDDEHQGDGMLEPIAQVQADALVVTRPDHAIFLPLADCVGAIIYDARNHILMVSHLGRHSVEQFGARKSIEYLHEYFDTHPADVQVWLSPAAGSDAYPLRAFNGRGLREVVTAQLIEAGVSFECIEVATVNTTDSDDYFSHSEFKAGERDFDGRFAIVAMMRD